MAVLTHIRSARVLASAIALAILASSANAQALRPMKGEVSSFGETFDIEVQPFNPHRHAIGVEMRVYDHEFRPVPSARIVPERFLLAGGNSRPVTARIPFAGYSPRYVRVCVESLPLRRSATQVRTRVCGKFKASRR